MTRWLSIIGIGADGVNGLAPSARILIENADVLVGAARHLAMVEKGAADRVDWTSSVMATAAALPSYRGRQVCVLVSGDPMWFGAGVAVCKHIPADERIILPAPGSFSLLAARMGWPLAEVETLTLHGRPFETLQARLYPCARLLILSDDGSTPARVAKALCDAGYPKSTLDVFEHMNGSAEKHISAQADQWSEAAIADLNAIAVTCVAGPNAMIWSTSPGLPDAAFDHDGKLTKRDVRAATLARLAPMPGERLLDIGLGNGSVAIEWLRFHPRNRAIGIESNADRRAVAARNAAALGVPQLSIIDGLAPDALAAVDGLVDAVFIGGGITVDGVLDAAWTRLCPGGRLVANGVTLEARERLIQAYQRWGGEIVEIAISHSDQVGAFTGLRPLMPVMQYAVTKPAGD